VHAVEVVRGAEVHEVLRLVGSAERPEEDVVRVGRAAAARNLTEAAIAREAKLGPSVGGAGRLVRLDVEAPRPWGAARHNDASSRRLTSTTPE